MTIYVHGYKSLVWKLFKRPPIEISGTPAQFEQYSTLNLTNDHIKMICTVVINWRFGFKEYCSLDAEDVYLIDYSKGRNESDITEMITTSIVRIQQTFNEVSKETRLPRLENEEKIIALRPGLQREVIEYLVSQLQ
jgi:hypothetical protein